MLKIGEFSKLAHITVKALRFYEKQGILMPASTDRWTGYRYYDTSQLTLAAKIKSLRQIDLSLDEIRSILFGADVAPILEKKSEELTKQKQQISVRLSIIKSILEDRQMDYQVTEKTIPETLVFTSETVLKSYSEIMVWIPSLGEECLKLNPDIKCAEPEYEFCEFLDGGYKETDIKVRHSQAVTSAGKENEHIKFRTLPKTKVLCIYHKGAYDTITDSYAFLMKYAEQNGYECAGFPRECYIDGIWNKESPQDWLTEIQLPIK